MGGTELLVGALIGAAVGTVGSTMLSSGNKSATPAPAKAPKPTPPPPPPKIPKAAIPEAPDTYADEMKAEDDRKRKKAQSLRRGRASTVLTSPQGLLDGQATVSGGKTQYNSKLGGGG